MRTVALDLGVNSISCCEVQDGKVIFRTTVRSFKALSDRLGPNTPPARVLFESCREAWHIHDQLAAAGHQPLMLDTIRAKQIGIGEHKRKTDRLDAEKLALALEAGRIPLAHVLSPPRRQLRHHLAVRKTLVEARAQQVTVVRGLARTFGHSLPSCATEHFVSALRRAALDEQTRALVAPLQASLEVLNTQIALVDDKLEQLAQQEPVIMQLATAPGVGLIVAAAFVSVIDDAGRFRDAHQVESYLGLVPSEDTTGGRRRLGAISKQGNSYLRALLVQSSWSISRRKDDDPLTRWAHSVAERRGKRIAVVALARRLAGVLWSMWRHGTVYDPAKVGLASARGLSQAAQSAAVRAQAMNKAARKSQRRRQTVEGNVN